MTIVHGEAVKSVARLKPFVAVYIREEFMGSAFSADQALQRLMRFAKSRDLEVSSAFIEKLDTPPHRFVTMSAQLIEAENSYLILSGIQHLSGLGNPVLIIESLKASGVQVLIATGE